MSCSSPRQLNGSLAGLYQTRLLFIRLLATLVCHRKLSGSLGGVYERLPMTRVLQLASLEFAPRSRVCMW
jgi:hypothetical protein